MVPRARSSRARLLRRTAVAVGTVVVVALGGAQGAVADGDRPHRGIEIARDAYGVPHVYADNERDLFFGYGYSIAQDRLFQIEAAKRSFTGTVSEAFGPGEDGEYVAYDIGVRQNRDPESLERQYAELPRARKAIFEGYADGVNAWIEKVQEDPENLMPKQFIDFGFEPAPWTGMDVVMIFVGTMANRYSDSTPELQNLMARDALIAQHGEDEGLALFDQLFWSFDPLSPTTVPAADVPPAERQPAANVRALKPTTDDAVATVTPGETASNLWAVGRKKADGANSILFNGPQHGYFTPALVYSVGLHGAGFDLVGNAGFGYPAVYFARNDHAGWGATAGGRDTVDIYQEQLSPEDLHQYLFKGKYLEMRHRTETVLVKGADPVAVDVYYTVHGRVLDFLEEEGIAYSKKRTWEGLELQTLLAWIDITKSENWDQFRRVASRMAISVNFYYNDKKGNIGYINTGKYMEQPENQDPRLPAIGTGEMEWTRLLPFSENYKVFNPEQGYIANWNNKQHPAATGPWGDIDRVQVIIDQLEAQESFTPAELWDVNRTVALTVISAKQFLPFLQAAAHGEPADSRVAEAVELLSQWNLLGEDENRDGTYDSPAYTLFTRWQQNVVQTVLADDVPSELISRPSTTRVDPSTAAVYHAFRGDEAGVPQTVDLLNGQSVEDVVRGALETTLNELTTEFGTADMTAWLTPTSPHVFSTENFVGIPQASPDEERELPVAMNRGTENHMVWFTGSDSKGCEVTPPGQSGFVSPDGETAEHYDDQLDLYANWECKPTWLDRDDVHVFAESVIRLP